MSFNFKSFYFWADLLFLFTWFFGFLGLCLLCFA